jgi:hypothetical protein
MPLTVFAVPVAFGNCGRCTIAARFEANAAVGEYYGYDVMRYIYSVKWKTVMYVCKVKQTPWPLVRKRTMPTERPPLVDEIFSTNFYG